MNNKIFKILTIVFMFGFFAVSTGSVSAATVGEIVSVLQKEKCSKEKHSKEKCFLGYKKYKDEVFKFENRPQERLICEIELSEEFKNLEAKYGKEWHDNILLILLFKYINENSSKIFGKEGEEFKRVLISEILSMRNKEERRGDKFIAGKMGEPVKCSLICCYGYLARKFV